LTQVIISFILTCFKEGQDATADCSFSALVKHLLCLYKESVRNDNRLGAVEDRAYSKLAADDAGIAGAPVNEAGVDILAEDAAAEEGGGGDDDAGGGVPPLVEHYRILDAEDNIDPEDLDHGDELYYFSNGNMREIDESIAALDVRIAGGGFLGDVLETLKLDRLVLSRFRELLAIPGETFRVNSSKETVARTDYCSSDENTKIYLVGTRHDPMNWRSCPETVRQKVGGLFGEATSRASRGRVGRIMFTVWAGEQEEIPIVLEGLEALVAWYYHFLLK
jgi:hypothetical protein